MKIPRQTCCVLIHVGPARRPARIAAFLPRRGWSIHTKGYLIYTSRSKSSGIRRGARAHMLAVEHLQGARLDPLAHVHHMDVDKLNCCPLNLLRTVNAMNPVNNRRDPYTGVWMSPAAWDRRYGTLQSIRDRADARELGHEGGDAPDWVTDPPMEVVHSDWNDTYVE